MIRRKFFEMFATKTKADNTGAPLLQILWSGKRELFFLEFENLSISSLRLLKICLRGPNFCRSLLFFSLWNPLTNVVRASQFRRLFPGHKFPVITVDMSSYQVCMDE